MNMCNDTSVMCPPGATIPGVFALLVSTLAICTKATRSWFYSYNSIILFSNTALLCADANVSPDWHKKSPNTDRSIPQSQSRQGGGNMPGQLPANPVNATSLGRRKERDMKYIARRWSWIATSESSPEVDCRPANGSLSTGNICRIFYGIFEMPSAEWYTSVDSRRLSTVELKSKVFLAVDSGACSEPPLQKT
eukprot:1177185-Prorocentrum_minimum.AAC.5